MWPSLTLRTLSQPAPAGPGRALYVWQGPTSLRVTQARAADLANQVRVKERGGNAAVVFVNELYGGPL